MGRERGLDRQLQAEIFDRLLLDQDHVMRFQELWRACRERFGSKATFTIYLNSLIEEGWIVRNAFSRKWVDYRLNLEKSEVKKFLRVFREELKGFSPSIDEYFELLYKSPSFTSLKERMKAREFRKLTAEERSQVVKDLVERLFSYFVAAFRNFTIGYVKHRKLGLFFEYSWRKAFENLTARWLEGISELFEEQPESTSKTVSRLGSTGFLAA